MQKLQLITASNTMLRKYPVIEAKSQILSSLCKIPARGWHILSVEEKKKNHR